MKSQEGAVQKILDRYRPARREDLIPILQEIQEETGYLSEEAIIKVGSRLKISTTKIFGLASFYDQFRFIPCGRIHIRICNGTSCFLNGSESIVRKIREELGIGEGQTTRDGIFSFEVATCMGGCINGPVILVNGEYHTGLQPEMIPDLLAKLKYIHEVN